MQLTGNWLIQKMISKLNCDYTTPNLMVKMVVLLSLRYAIVSK